MGEVTDQIAIALGVLATCFAGPAAAFFVLIRRKAKARQNRRSPIGIALLRGPGHSLREQLDEANNDLTWDLVLLMVVPLLVLTFFLAQSHLRGLPRTAHLAPVYAVAAIAFIAYMLRKLLNASTRLDHLKAGYDAEVAVGQELDQLMRQGAATFHDLPAEQFNIDHVVVAAEGVFAIETKGFNYGLSKIEVQKLAYFLQEAGGPLDLPFVKHHYGPYSDTLRHALNTMEGHFIRGLGDGVVEAEIEPTEDALAEAEAFIAEQSHAALADQVARVGRLIEGYQSSYGMELLASVHWVATREPGVQSIDDAVAAVHAWNDRKRQLMRPEHISAAWHRLKNEGWLSTAR